jgi:hypothetical protein
MSRYFPHARTRTGFNYIGVRGMEVLAPALFVPRRSPGAPPPPPLRALHLDGNYLEEHGTGALVKALIAAEGPPYLAKLTLSQNKLRDEGAVSISSLFMHPRRGCVCLKCGAWLH